MTDDLVYLNEIMPVIKKAIGGCQKCLQKAAWAMKEAYDEPVVAEYLEGGPAPGHEFPGKEDKKHEKVAFKYGKEGKQLDPKDHHVTIEPHPKIEKAIDALTKIAAMKSELTGHTNLISSLKALNAIRKAGLEPAPMPPPAAGAGAGGGDRLCPRCGGEPCSCPGEAASSMMSSAEGDAGEGSESQKTGVVATAEQISGPKKERPV